MNYKTYWVNPLMLDHYWFNSEVQSCLQRTYKTFPKIGSLESVYNKCKNLESILFIQECEGKVIFAGIAEFLREKGFITKKSGKRKRRKYTVLNVWHGSGKDFAVDFDQLDTVAKQMAAIVNAPIIQIEGRLGWKKHTLPRGYSIHSSSKSSCGKTYLIFRKEI